MGGISKLGASAGASEFCEWVQVGIDVYILHRKYQVKPHSSPWFSAACAATIAHRNHFFCMYPALFSGHFCYWKMVVKNLELSFKTQS